MAPQKPKRPSMLQRQRQLRAQQQQVKRASSKQLPAGGDSSGNSRQARGQRANTSRAQAANNQRIINRGIEGFIRRGNEQDKLDKAAQGTRGSGTRTAGAGGGLARRPSSAVTTTNRGNSQPPKPGSQPTADPGGALAKRPSASLVKPQAKPPAQRSGAIEKAGPTIDVNANTPKIGAGNPTVRTGQPGPSRAMLPPAAQPPAKPSLRSALRGGVGKGNAAIIALSAANAVQDSLMTPEQRKRKAEAEIRPLTMADMPGIGGGSRGVRTGTASGRTGRGGTTADARTSTAAKPRVGNINPKEGTGRGGPSDVKKTRTQTPTKPAAASTPSSSPSPRRQASSSGSGGTTRPRSSSAPSTSSNAGMKNQDKNYRGSLFEKTFGYKPGQAPDQMKMKDNFDTKSDIYSPSTKVDGSKLDALKIDQKKVNEYTRRKRRYSD